MTNLRNRALATVALAVGVLTVGGAAWSYWAVSATGSGSARIGVLAAPSAVVASPSDRTVAVGWTGPVAPDGGAVDGYYVLRSTGAPGGTCASSPASLLASTTTGCHDTGVAPGTYTYTVVAVYRSWTSTTYSAPVTVVAADAHHFTVTAPVGATAGIAFDATITARTSAGATANGYTGSKNVVWSGPGTAPSGATATFSSTVTFAGGVGTATVTLVKAETVALTATEGGLSGTSSAIVVGHGAATRFAVSAPTPQVAGTSFTVTATAQDAFQNTATGYSGARSVSWSGPGNAPSGTAPAYPASVTFTGGLASASVTLAKAGTATLTATEGAVTGTSPSIEVHAGMPSRLAWTSVNAAGTGGCLFSCTRQLGNNSELVARVSVTDALGNTVSDLGNGHAVTVSTPASGAGSGGAFTAPTSGTSVTLTIAPSGAADSTATFTFRTQNGNWTSDSLTAASASGTAYTVATATVTKQ